MSRAKKWLLGAVLSPFVLFFLLAFLLYIPPVQNWAVRQVARYVSDNTQWGVSVGSVRLVFPLDLGINNLILTTENDSISRQQDTIANVRSVVADVKLLPLFKGNVVINKLQVDDLKLNTLSLVDAARVHGNVGKLYLRSKGISLGDETVDIDDARLCDARLTVAMNDSVPEDTSTTENNWVISLAKLSVERTQATIHMPGDTLVIGAYLGNATAREGVFDLGKGAYTLAQLNWKGGRLSYDNRYEKAQKGLDVNHIALADVALGIDSLSYVDNKLALNIKNCSFGEKCGFKVSDINGRIALDTAKVSLPLFKLTTPNSSVQAKMAMDFNAFDETNPGVLDLNLTGNLGKQDIVALAGDLPSAFVKQWPNHPLGMKCLFTGNMKKARLAGLQLALPTSFSLSAKGQMQNLTDMDRLVADLSFKATATNLDYVMAFLPQSVTSQVRLPHGMALNGTLAAQGRKYQTAMSLREGMGSVNLNARVNTNTMAYSGDIDVKALNLSHFLVGTDIGVFTGQLTAEGMGTDVFSNKTHLTAKAGVTDLKMMGYDFAGLSAALDLKDGTAKAEMQNYNDLLSGEVKLNALLQKNTVKANLACDLARLDLYKLKITKNPLTLAFRTNMAVATDLNEMYKLEGSIANITVRDTLRDYHPENIYADLLTQKDTTRADISCGDFRLKLNASGGYKRLMRHSDQIMAEMQRQMENRYIDQLKLRACLPEMCLLLQVGKENMFSRALKYFGVDVARTFIDMDTSPVAGINGVVKVDSLVASGFQIDTIRLTLKSDSAKTDFQGQVRNNRRNPQYVFNALFGGTFYERGLYFGTRVLDADDKVGVALGVKASMEDNGIKVSIGGPLDPILGYKKFSINKDNYVMLTDDKRVSADVRLRADDGMGVQLYSNDSTEALQDLTLGLTKFELSKLMSVLPYLPDIAGEMNGDFHVIKTSENLSVSSSVTIDNMEYEHCKMGNIGSEFVYMPLEDGTHYVDGTLSCNDMEVGTIAGTYNSEKDDGVIDATLSLAKTPLKLLNGFIPDQMFGFKGYCTGDLNVKGSLSKPQVNGTLSLDSAYMASEPYGVELRFADTPVKISNSHMTFDDFKMYAHNGTPLTINGYLDFSDMDQMYLQTRIKADNYLLIDSKENMRSEAYGKAYVNFLGMVRGPLTSLQMRGKLDVLGTTDMTYILRDTPLTTDTQLDDLVKFTNFNGKETVEVARPELTGIDIDLTINIDEGAHILCALNTDHSNYVDLIGGGTLRMQYNSVDDLRLTGRYTLSNGEMKYSLPVIPLKTFTIQDGSYVEFVGDAMNPTLNITATEETKSSVSTDGGSGRTVAFECGVKITQTLQDMGLEFIIDAPEDMTIHNELQTMTAENRGKLAVTMLTTGMYLADGNTSAFSMNSALSAFLNSQISSISGSALRTLDLSFGMDNAIDGTGDTRTDYSFKFSKRFWNNRLSIVVGGKLSTGSEVANQNNTFFDNVTFEYRLSQNSNKYLKLFYDRDSYDWLEGNVEQFGAGFMYKRKIQSLGDLFKLKKLTDYFSLQKKDSVKVEGDNK